MLYDAENCRNEINESKSKKWVMPTIVLTRKLLNCFMNE